MSRFHPDEREDQAEGESGDDRRVDGGIETVGNEIERPRCDQLIGLDVGAKRQSVPGEHRTRRHDADPDVLKFLGGRELQTGGHLLHAGNLQRQLRGIAQHLLGQVGTHRVIDEQRLGDR